ncbi:MAG: hypothetical protein J6Y54_01305, partial [Lentisphaeria bacterium]|nr:hypothetical protein [Lentisphaeria bacterium]
MGYSNPTTSAEYTLPASTELISSTIANAAYYTSDVYAQSLTVASKCKVTDVTVESGGKMTKATMAAASSGTFTRITVGNSGEVRLGNYNNASNFTVLSGGKLYTGSSVYLHNADIRAGATYSRLDSTRIGGRLTNIQQGVTYALGKVMGDDFYISNGVIRNLDVTARTIGGSTYKELNIYELIVSGGFVNNGARLVVSNTGNSDDAAEVYDLTIRTGGSATIQSGLLVSNLTAETGASVGLGGAVCIDIDIAAGVTVNYGASNTLYLGGGKTTIASGVVTGNRLGADFAAAAGVGTDLEVANTYNINILSGFTVSSGNVLAGGMLTVSSGGSAKEFTVSGADAWLVASQNAEVTDITVSDGGRMKTSGTGAIITGIDVGSGGAASFGQGNTVTDLIVLSGGSLYTGNNFKVYNAVVSSGATWSKTNTAQVGGRNTDIKQGVVYGLVDLGVDFYISGGVASNLDLTSRTVGGQSYNQLHLFEVTVSGGFVNDKTRLVVSSTDSADDAEVYDLTVRTGGSASFQAGLLVSNLKVETNTSVGFGDNVKCIDLDIADGATVNFGTYKNINLGGSKTVIAAGVVTNNVLGADFAAATGIGTDLEVANTYNVNILDGFTVSSGNVLAGGTLAISNGGVASATTVQTDGALNVLAGATVSDLVVSTGARVDFVRDALFTGADTNVAASTFYYDGAADALGFSIQDGVVKDLGSDGNAYRIRLGDGLVVSDAVVRDDWRISAFGDATISGAEVIVGGTTSAAVLLKGSNTAYNVTLTGGSGYQAVLNLDGTGASASGTVVNSGGKLGIGAAAGGIEDTVVKAGGKLQFSAGAAASTGKLLTLDFTGGSSLEINKLDLIDSTTRVEAKGLAVGGTYTLTAGTATTTLSVCCDSTAVYDNAVRGGTSYTNAFIGKTWDFSTGKTIEVTEFDVGAAKAAAGAITNADKALNGTDRAAKWDADTVYTASVTLADNSLAGDAWLVIDGTNISTALYGASGNYAHTVNINAKSGTIRNLAAGAQTGDTVGAVNLIFAGAELDGTGYAGGFGNVTGEVKTQIAAGTFAKDFYAGALANKLATATGVGNVSMTIDGGTFDGNIYGASAVKTNTTKGNGTRHTAGNVTLTITGGSTTKGDEACIFAGGYATGDATGTVYTVDSVTATISGGDWGEAAGGRGVFGGIMASGVEAEVLGNVNITISGDATMGNVYGGGWAQKTGGKSIVGDVSINIAGGTIANVFGGGTHSTSGGTTEAGEVTITVSGGDISGAIYARGQLEGDTTGTAAVIFTGATDFDCGVFGYSYVGGATGGATLSYTGYTGEFSGNIGGFDGITFGGATAMELATAADDVTNSNWE